MEYNKFGKTSRLSLKVTERNGCTILEDVHFTAPFKVMQPFPDRDGGIKVMYLTASAGIMEGDNQEFEIEIGTGANIELLSQAYEKIHKMKDGCAIRKTRISVEKNACFRYCPHPSIPFQDSAFQSQTRVDLADPTSHFAMNEIITCGRYARDEIFAYRFFINMTEIYRGNTLIYRDNSRYLPRLSQMDGVGMYESYYHLCNIFMTGAELLNPKDFIKDINGLLVHEHLEGGITRLADGDFALRILGRRAQLLEEVSAAIIKRWTKMISK